MKGSYRCRWRIDQMYAVVRTGGKQLRVSPGDVVKGEKLPQGAGTPPGVHEAFDPGNPGGLTIPGGRERKWRIKRESAVPGTDGTARANGSASRRTAERS